MDKQDLFTKFPFLMETNSNNFFGIMRIKGQVYKINLTIPNFPLVDEACSIAVSIGLTPVEIEIDQLRINHSTVLELMSYIEMTLNQLESFSKIDKIISCTERVQTILNQLEHLLKDPSYKIFISSDYKRINISNFDEYESEHYLHLIVNDNASVISVDSHSLPNVKNIDSMFSSSCATIETHINTFLRTLKELETFYAHMHKIDAHCFTVDPVITTKSNERTFKIEENIYVRIVVDPLSPSSLVTNIIGPTYGIEKFRNKYNAHIRNWDINLDIHENLLRIFDLSCFPMKNEFENEEKEKQCGICYAYRCNLQIPFISCDNQKCFLIYHTSCLKKWFSTLPDSKTLLNVSFGNCPYCKEKLSTSFVSLLEMD